MGKSLVLGFFDGVHKAHKAVINSALEISDDVVLITFKESPAKYFVQDVKYVLSRKNSLDKIRAVGVKNIVELDFNKIAKMSAGEYLEKLIKMYSPISISTGFNHTFGVNKSGTPKFLSDNQKKYNYRYICVAPVKIENEVVSSTLIKNYLAKGNIQKASSLLESNFILEGTVIHGAKLGRTIGFPTANISYPSELVQIPFGVYSVMLTIENHGELLKGIMNWGMKPTVNNTIEPIAEVHIFNFNNDLYGKNIKVEVLKQIRGEQKFSSLEELKIQIKKDIENA